MLLCLAWARKLCGAEESAGAREGCSEDKSNRAFGSPVQAVLQTAGFGKHSSRIDLSALRSPLEA